MTEQVHTFCRVCEPQCGLIAEVAEGRIQSLQSDPGNPASQGFSCNKGIQFLHVHQDPDRPTHPLKRSNPRQEDEGDFIKMGWDDAMTEIGGRLGEIVRQHGDGAIALFMGNPHAFNSTLLTNEDVLMAGFGTGPRFGAYTIDCANKIAGSEAIFGSGMVHPIPDIVHTDYFLALGTNPAVSHMAIMDVSDPMAKLRAIKRRGGKTVFINPRIIESATPETGEVVLIRPDTDVYLLAAVLHEIAFGLACDQTYAREHGRNIDALLDFVKHWPAERAAQVTGIEIDQIREIARDFHAAPAACVQMSTGVNMGAHGLIAYWLVQMISLMTGNLGRRGGNIYSPGICPTAHLAKPEQADPFFETEFGRLRKIGGQLPCNLMADILQSDRQPIKALIVIGGNPILSVPGEERLRTALQKLDLIVSIDIYRTATGELADFILPTKDFLEREDVNVLGNGLQLEPHVQYTDAVVPARGERRDDWWILARMLQAMGRPSMLDDLDPDPFGAINAMLNYRDLSIERLKQLPYNTAMLPDPDPDDLFRFGVQTDDGLIDCCPTIFTPAYRAIEDHWDKVRAEPVDQLKMITRRTGLMVNSWMSNLAIYKKGAHMTNPLWMSPADAKTRGLRPGGEVLVRSEFGEIVADLVLDDTLKDGVVAMSHGWGQRKSFGMKNAQRYPGVNVNRLSPVGPGSFDPISMQAKLTGINVTVTPGPLGA